MLCEKDDQYKIMTGEVNPTNTADVNGRWWFRFPEQFITSKNRKWIEVHHVRISWQNNIGGQEMTNDCVLHADFIKRDAYLDHTVMICNETRTKYKKYEYTSADQYFSIWFSSFANSRFNFAYGTTKFLIELMLIY